LSETRQLTEGVFDRFTPTELDAVKVKVEADRRNITVAQLLRDTTLRTVRAAF
jgi:hypothetical protein